MNERKGLVAMATLAAVLVLTAAAPSIQAQSAPQVPKGWTFSLPAGSPQNGKIVFMRMECYSCHTVSIPGKKFPQGSGGIGPALTPAYAKLPAAYLADSLIKAHTVVAAPGYVLKAGQAGMGKYNHFLTVQELIDLVAFLNQLPGSGAK
jgi:cytochrome c551/c552